MKYPKPKLFKPTKKDMDEALNQVSKHLSPDKVVIGNEGQKVRGSRINKV